MIYWLFLETVVIPQGRIRIFEIFELRVSLEEAVEYFMQGADFSFGNGFDMPNTCSNIACRIRPENVLL